MLVRGILIGNDKLGHFLQDGFLYWELATGNRLEPEYESGTDTEVFKDLKCQNNPEDWGKVTEGGKWGLRTTGVYSNADLAANRAGFQFYTDLAANPNMRFTLARYITPNWNEEINPSLYRSDVGKQVWQNVLANSTWETQSADLMTPSGGIVTITFNFSFNQPGYMGEFYYSSPASGAVKGVITNRVMTFKQEKMGSYDVISGIYLTFDWQAGPKKGTASLASKNERTLEGRWRTEDSASNGGMWTLTNGKRAILGKVGWDQPEVQQEVKHRGDPPPGAIPRN
jgi:hypothetical protein